LTEKVKNILKDELNVDAVSDQSAQEDFPEWDSLTYMRIVAAIESNFKIEINAQNINNFNSVPNIVREIGIKR